MTTDVLIQAATDLFLQAYGAKRYASHAPPRVQWLYLGAALLAVGVKLPPDYARSGKRWGK
jgi:hypothetical protein